MSSKAIDCMVSFVGYSETGLSERRKSERFAKLRVLDLSSNDIFSPSADVSRPSDSQRSSSSAFLPLSSPSPQPSSFLLNLFIFSSPGAWLLFCFIFAHPHLNRACLSFSSAASDFACSISGASRCTQRAR
eukprot:264249-Hanusia_phi.AAC.2